MQSLNRENRGPRLIVLENVCGALASHGGKDFASIGDALARRYRFGAVVIDAVHFVPQSRPRLFIIGIQNNLQIADSLVQSKADSAWQPEHLVTAQKKLSRQAKAAWVWWKLPEPPELESAFSELIDDAPGGVAWHTQAETRRLLSMMSPLNRRKVREARRAGVRKVGGIYKRMRENKDGIRVQRAEVRFDDISGCLRTPVGGSSRQTILLVEGARVRSRLLSPREACRLMGLADTYILPDKYNEAYHLAGDGVVVPVVRFLAAHLLEPLYAAARAQGQEAA